MEALPPEKVGIAEAKLISVYLANNSCSDDLAKRYLDAITIQDIRLSDTELKIWNWAIKSSFRLGAIDSGLALQNPKSQIRRKIFLMMAIMEASTAYCDAFIPKEKSKISVLFNISWLGVRAVALALIGVLVLKFFKH